MPGNLSDNRAHYYDTEIGRFTGVDPLAADAPDWTPYRYGFNNPILFIDPDGNFESEKDARAYAKEQGIKIRPKSWIGKLFTSGSRSNIVENSDGTFSIEDRKTSITDYGGELGIMEAPIVKANDLMDYETLGDGSAAFTYRDGSVRIGGEIPAYIGGTAPTPGKGYKHIKTIGDKYDVFEKTVKAKKLSGQARAVYTKVINQAGRTIRFFKDAFKRDGRHYERANYHPHKSRSKKLD